MDISTKDGPLAMDMNPTQHSITQPQPQPAQIYRFYASSPRADAPANTHTYTHIQTGVAAAAGSRGGATAVIRSSLFVAGLSLFSEICQVYQVSASLSASLSLPLSLSPPRILSLDPSGSCLVSPRFSRSSLGPSNARDPTRCTAGAAPATALRTGRENADKTGRVLEPKTANNARLAAPRAHGEGAKSMQLGDPGRCGRSEAQSGMPGHARTPRRKRKMSATGIGNVAKEFVEP